MPDTAVHKERFAKKAAAFDFDGDFLYPKALLRKVKRAKREMEAISRSLAKGRELPGEEWFRDNFSLYLTSCQSFFEALQNKRAVKMRVYREGPDAGLPLFYPLLQEYIAFAPGDGEAALKEFITLFGEKQPFTSAEVAVFPLLLQAAALIALHRFYTHAGDGGPQSLQRWFQLLRSMPNIDMEAVFEETWVERMLLADPSGIYPAMEKESKALYRGALSDLARGLGQEEAAVARVCLELAQGNRGEQGHFGFYLLKEAGQAAAAAVFHKANPLKKAGVKVYALWGLAGFLVIMGALALLFHSLGWPVFLIVTFVWPLWEMIWYLLNHYERHFGRVNLLPKLDFRDELPEEAATMVVISALLHRPEEAVHILERLEDHFLSNRDKNLSYAVMADLPDSTKRKEPEDEEVLDAAFRGVEALNRKYPGYGFYVFFRNREYNPRDRVYMAWERKRGALTALNDFLRNVNAEKIIASSVDREHFAKIQYIIALDSDTLLPLTTAFRLIGAIHHPLQRPYFHSETNTLVGHGIIAPRMGLTIASLNQSRFARVYGFAGGLHPYITGESNFYQDLAGRGIYGGKGIYHIDSFRAATKDLPENRILSHDLLEGNLLNAAYASDIVLLDPFPRRFFAYARRQHRWVRGDFQLLPWLLPQVPGNRGRMKNPLDLLARYQIVDNLRRPGLPILLMSAILLAALQPGANLIIGLLLFFALFPELNSIFLALLRRRWWESGVLFLRLLLSVALMPYFAILNLDAIVKTLGRLITRRRLLQWETAAAVEHRLRTAGALPFDWIFAIAYYIIGLWLVFVRIWTGVLPVTVILVAVFWVLGPFFLCVLQWRPRSYHVNEEEREYLLRLSWEIWDYFGHSLTAEDHFLPPDNVQMYPLKGKARRTSPSNIGLFLSSLCLGLDMGFSGVKSWSDRLASIFGTLEKLPKFRGHLYNWYDTGSLAVLSPAYVSTVDSGNFLASLYAVEEYLGSALDLPLFSAARGEALSFLGELTGKGSRFRPAGAYDLGQWKEFLRRLEGNTYGDVFWQKQLQQAREDAQAEAEFFCPVGLPIAVAAPLLAAKTLRELQNAFFPALERAEGTKEIGTELRKAQARVDMLIDTIEELKDKARLMKAGMDFSFLYNEKRKLLHIGYRPEENQLDPCWYDQIASEIRLTSYLLLGRGELPLEHWQHYGRHLNKAYGRKGLLSWSGTAFEYFLPSLFLVEEPHSLLGASLAFAVRSQKRYASSFRRQKLPWGISESAFYYFDWDMHYQYRAFGVPALALDDVSGDDMVFAPYGSILALSLDPAAVLKNLRRWDRLGVRGEWGFYEAADFTKRRLLPREEYGIVKSYMVHHQAMSFLALGNFLSGGCFKRRFNAIPEVRSAKTLLEEPMPSGHIRRPLENKVEWQCRNQEGSLLFTRDKALMGQRPYCHFLREGAYCLFINSRGEGYSSYRGMRLNPWRAGDFLRPGGHFFFLDDGKGDPWSATLAPLGKGEAAYEMWDDSVVFERQERDIFVRTTVFLLPDGAGEVRLLRISNRGAEKRNLKVYSYLEPLLGDDRAYRAHKGFYKFFFRGSYDAGRVRALLFRRKEGISSPAVGLQGRHFGKTKVCWEYYGDREDFIGRGRNLFRPKLPSHGAAASLDPLLSLGASCTLGPKEAVTLAFVLAVGETETAATETLNQYETLPALEEARHLVSLRTVSCRERDGFARERVQQLTAALLYGGGNRAVYGDIMLAGIEKKDLLYRYGISGDRPIVLLDYSAGRETLLEPLFQALSYWDKLHFPVDVIILSEESESQYHSVAAQLKPEAPKLSGCGLVFLDKRVLDERELGFYYGSADLILDESIFDGESSTVFMPQPTLVPSALPADAPQGFVGDVFWIQGREAAPLPAPWVNVLANPNFGTIVSERGAAFTWSENSRENPISAWSNDPVEDASGEGFFFLRQGQCHLLLPWAGEMAVGHGHGFSVFRGEFGPLAAKTTVCVPLEDSVKLIRVEVKNNGEDNEILRLFSYIRPICGREDAGVCTILEGNALLAKNLFAGENKGVFLTADQPPVFFGGSYGDIFPPGTDRPAPQEAGTMGFADHPLLSYGCEMTVLPGEEKAVTFLVGVYDHRIDVERLRETYFAQDAVGETRAFWRDFTGRLQLDGPDEEVNQLVNVSLLYQTVTARLWGRTSFYQCGGAFGFRDQLQDVLALLYTAPQLARDQILRHGARQFPEGDVLHWWHEGAELKGVRTRFSDDRLWLPYVTAQYVEITGDAAILDEQLPYLEGEPLPEGVGERYDVFAVGEESGSLYEHCLRAIDISLAFGRHGLPLMGGGDWNDGMNRVGWEGRGESVWLGFFLYDILGRFAVICRGQGEEQRSNDYETVQKQLAIALNEGGYDGRWYLRAYFDDGSPLGSHLNAACALDSLSQSWASLSGAGEEDKVALGLDAAWDALVDKENHLIRLFTPPFREGEPNPGYIQDYPPGIRENGGQYTHGALWLLSAYARRGAADRAALLLHYLNPLKKTEAERQVYRLEPYVIAADIYSVSPYAGRGGWSWYTGAAAWFYRILVKDILGMEKIGDRLTFAPLVLPGWNRWRIRYTFGASPYVFTFYGDGPGPAEIAAVTVDGKPQRDKRIHLLDDGEKHRVEIVLRRRQ